MNVNLTDISIPAETKVSVTSHVNVTVQSTQRMEVWL